MPSIYLKQRTGSYFLGFVTVTEEDYCPSKLFKKFKHELKKPLEGSIWIYNEKFYLESNILDLFSPPKSLTITLDNSHTSAKLKEAHVYYNQYDTNQTPLVLVFKFQNDGTTVENKYSIWSKFNGKLTNGGQTVNINTLSRYGEDEKCILKDLLKENDSLETILTYNIGKTEGDTSNGHNGNDKYNGGKIKVKDDTSKGEPKLSENGFKCYKHTPVNGYADKKACVIFDGNVLMQKGGTEEVKDIQDKQYECIRVYFANRVKKKSLVNGGKQIDVPLLIELTKTSPPNDPDYYVHKRNPKNGTEYYWEKLPGDNGTGNTLKDLLVDMGFGMTKSDPGYEKLKTLLNGAGVIQDQGNSDLGDLSQKLKGITGSQLQAMLKERVGEGGDESQKSFLSLLLQKIEFDLLDSVVILLDKREKDNKYGHSYITSVINTLEPKRDINRVYLDKGGPKTIKIYDKSGIDDKCTKNYGYKLLEHDLSEVSQVISDSNNNRFGIRFLIPSKTKAGHYNQLKLYKEDKTDPENLEYMYYDSRNKKLYLYFYGRDPRPLILCYGKNAFIPKKLKDPSKDNQVDVDYTKWLKVKEITSCVCAGEGTSGGNKAILDSLNDVTGFLNPVQINPTQIPEVAKGAITAEPLEPSGKQATYELHKYTETTIINMGISTTKLTCYRKFTYQPNGTNGSGTNGKRHDGFRLGNILHTNTSRSGLHSPLNYTNESIMNKYHPLIGVTVFYYQHDKQYEDPLLIELEFKVNWSVETSKEKEYWKLTQLPNSEEQTGMKWQKDNDADPKVKVGGQKLVEYLDCIRHSLKKILRIELQHNSTKQYNLTGRSSNLPESGFSDFGYDKKIQVVECIDSECTKLKENNYVCLQHKVSAIADLEQHQISGLAMTLPGKTNNQAVEIPIYNENQGGEGSNGQQKYLYYNSCMGDVYVYFYCKKGSKTPDTVPLMVLFNGKFYEPPSRDEYLQNWSHQLVLKDVKKPCGSEVEEARNNEYSYEILVTMLNFTNEELNRIELDGSKVKSGKYGLPEPIGKQLSPAFNTERVNVTCQDGPTKLTPQTTPIYKRVIHRTVNGFSFGEIHHKKQEIVESGGIQVDSTNTISIEKLGHKRFVEENNPNTVVAYYSTGDNTFKLPQLIVLLQTSEPITEHTDPITASDSTKYGYYVLATGDSGGYKYEWREPVETPLTLDDKTEYSLLNAIVILVDKTTQYDEGEISSAVTSATIKSPGNTTDVNRLKQRTVGVHEETGTNAEHYGDPAKCVSKYGYKLFAHDINGLVEWTGLTVQPSIPLIGGLRFLIPSNTMQSKYDEINLYQDEKITGSVDRLYHTPKKNPENTRNKVYVFFYESDPRPLLLCYGGNAYKPRKQGEPTAEKQVNVNYTEWTRASKISNCVCLAPGVAGNDENILDTLLNVVLFLNPVQLNPFEIPREASSTIIKPTKSPRPEEFTNSTYKLHKFTPDKTVKMKITRENVECYEKCTYESNGISGDKTGFRLGNVFYHGTFTETPKGTVNYTSEPNGLSTRNTRNYNPLLKVDTYYYDRDTKYEDPLLVVLIFGNVGVGIDTVPKEYWKLKTRNANSMNWEKDPKAETPLREGGNKLVIYLDSIRYLLKKLVRIELQHNSKFSYPFTGRSASGTSGSGFKPIGSGQQIKVEEPNDISCSNLKEKGYICFRHTLTLLRSQDHHQIGGVVMTLPSKKGANEAIEIPLHDSDNGQQKHLYYNSCMGHLTVYVYFYIKKDEIPDTVPLMLRYNDKYYIPTDRDEYFKKWEDWGIEFKTPCGSKNETGDDSYQVLAELLELTNQELNRIELTHKINDKPTSTYGIPPPKQTPNDLKFDLNRVKVTKIPSKPIDNRPYVKLVHRTINEFRIGEIWYKEKEITKDGGILVNGSGQKIDVKNGLYTLFTEKNNPNTVVVYYSKTDSDFKLPQLIVLVNTDKPILQDQQPISATSGTSYGYYVLATGDRGIGYQYKWLEPDDQPLTLDDETELSLLNSVVILLERRLNGSCTPNKYGDIQIGPAVKKAIELKSLKSSPGLENDINRLKNKDITIKDVTEEPPESLLKKAGFRGISHDLSTIVNFNIKGSHSISLIASLRFLIPTADGGGEYRLLTLKESTTSKENITLFHQNKQDCVCVYFYDKDPRPLLLCYNNKAYRAPNKLLYDLQQWYQGTKITECPCDKNNGTYLLIALVHVSNYLNSVQIGRVSKGPYVVHKFNGENIIIKVSVTKGKNKFCYDKYIHTHKGAMKSEEYVKNPKAGEGPPDARQAAEGFRLGSITYSGKSIEDWTDQQPSPEKKKVKLISSITTDQPPYNPASEVVVYYYKGDPNHKNPLLVSLKNNENYQPYYELQKSSSTSIKRYKKEDKQIKLEDSPKSELEQILDTILFNISKRLQIILDQRPEPIQLCPIEKKRIKYLETKKRFRELSYPEMGYQSFKDAIYVTANMTKSIVEEGLLGYKNPDSYDYINKGDCKEREPEQYNPELTTLVPTYPARVYNNTGQRESGDSGTTQIKVKQIDCKELISKGYRCYQHKISDIKDIEQFGGLRLFLWDTRGIDEQDKSLDDCKVTQPKNDSKKQCCEIKLATCNYVEEVELTHIPYTVCKGDLYVYFYGSDPRPLLLCYNGQAYKPYDLNTYITLIR